MLWNKQARDYGGCHKVPENHSFVARTTGNFPRRSDVFSFPGGAEVGLFPALAGAGKSGMQEARVGALMSPKQPQVAAR